MIMVITEEEVHNVVARGLLCGDSAVMPCASAKHQGEEINGIYSAFKAIFQAEDVLRNVHAAFFMQKKKGPEKRAP